MNREQLESAIRAELSHVMDPELHRDIISLNMVRDLAVSGTVASMRIVLTTPACPLKDQIQHEIEDALIGVVAGITRVEIRWDAEVSRSQTIPGRQEIPGVRNLIAVSAGKGGVGKSTVAVNLAFALQRSGARVGILDADIYGPNVPIMLGIENEEIKGTNEAMLPVDVAGLKVMSFGMLLKPGQPVIWRGPMLGKALRELMYQVAWGELDYLIVDLPPGTGDVQLSLAQSAPLAGAVIVTTPQDVSVSDVSRGIAMFQQLNVPVFGIIENMSTFVCQHCGDVTPIFGEGGGATIASMYNLELLGSLPLDPKIRLSGGASRSVIVTEPEGPMAKAFIAVAERLAAQVSTTNFTASSGPVLPSGPRIPLKTS